MEYGTFNQNSHVDKSSKIKFSKFLAVVLILILIATTTYVWVSISDSKELVNEIKMKPVFYKVSIEV